MARVDEAAAKLELERAAECYEQAEQLTQIADELRKAARHHQHEAEELCGVAHRRLR